MRTIIEQLESRTLLEASPIIVVNPQPSIIQILDTDRPSATLAAPAKDGIVYQAALNARRYIDVVIWDKGHSKLNPATVTDAAQEFTLSGSGAAGVVVNGAATLVTDKVVPAGGTAPDKGSHVYRYTFTGNFTPGEVTLRFTAGTYADFSGNLNVSSPKPFYVTSKRVIGYLPDYESSRYDTIDYGALTHVNFFAISPDAAGNIITPPSAFITKMKGVVSEAHYGGDTVSISVIDANPNPWQNGTISFPPLAASAAARTNFANQLVAFCQTHKLDGVDLDWEPVKDSEVASYGTLISTLRTAFAPHGLMLSAAVHASHKDIPASAANHLDWVGVMTYDIKAADHSTYADTLSYLASWNSYGVPKSKIVMGVPFYGRDVNWGYKTYRDIVTQYAPAASVNSTNGWGFTGVDTMKQKMNYVYDNGNAGMMIWELGEDYFNSAGDTTSASLLPAIKSVVVTRASSASAKPVTQSLTDDNGSPLKRRDVKRQLAAELLGETKHLLR